MTRPKITIIGAGNVGATTGLWIAKRNIADVVLIDITEGLAAGKALDLMEASPLEDIEVSITGTDQLAAVAQSNIVVITAGLPRKPGMTRDDLLAANANIIRPTAEAVKTHAPQAILIVVTNPLDVMAALAQHVTGFPRERVLGMAGTLDTARFRYFVSEALQIKAADVDAMVLGGHGPQMVPLLAHSTAQGKPLTEQLDASALQQLVQRTRDGGAEIVKLLKTGSAFYAPGASVAVMVEAILHDTGAVLPCSVQLRGEYGLNDVFVGVPVALGQGGMRHIVELEVTDAERAALHQSAGHVKESMTAIGV